MIRVVPLTAGAHTYVTSWRDTLWTRGTSLLRCVVGGLVSFQVFRACGGGVVIGVVLLQIILCRQF